MAQEAPSQTVLQPNMSAGTAGFNAAKVLGLHIQTIFCSAESLYNGAYCWKQHLYGGLCANPFDSSLNGLMDFARKSRPD
jgi:hypothetical protein